MKARTALVSALCALILIACSSGVDVNSPTVVSIWGDQPQESGTPVTVYLKKVTEAFNAANPGKTLVWLPQKETGILLLDKLKAVVEENKAPDVIQSQGGLLMQPFAEMERILDLTAELSDIASCKAARDVMRWNDKIYGVAPFFSVAGLFVNETKFKELGIKIPTTVSEMEAAAEVLKANGIQPIAVDGTDKRSVSYLFMYLVNRIGGDAIQQSLDRKLRFDAPVYRQAGEKLKSWAKKGYFGALPSAEKAANLMAGGKAGMQVTGSWMCSLYDDPSKTNVTIGFYPFPVIPGGKGAATDILGMSEVSFIGTVKPVIKRELVVQFMRTAMSPDILKGDNGMICSDPSYPPKDRLLRMAADVFYNASTLRFYWEYDLPAATGAAVADTASACLSPDADVNALFKKLEAVAQNEMGGTVDF